MKQVSIPSGANLPELYRQWAGDYPKFFKMDTLSKLGFLLAEMLAHDEPDRFTFREDRAVLVFSREGCVANDRHYAESMLDFPSPALFVYTLFFKKYNELINEMSKLYNAESAKDYEPLTDEEKEFLFKNSK